MIKILELMMLIKLLKGKIKYFSSTIQYIDIQIKIYYIIAKEKPLKWRKKFATGFNLVI